MIIVYYIQQKNLIKIYFIEIIDRTFMPYLIKKICDGI
jgi:hypothetical protein